MNDFESRARAAGRAAREAVEPATELTVRVPQRHRPAALVASAAALVIAMIVAGVVAFSGSTRSGEPAGTTALCTTMASLGRASSAAGSDELLQAMLRTAPPELRDDIRALVDHPSDSGQLTGRERTVFLERYTRVTVWTQVHCAPEAATSGVAPALQRYAPEPLPAGLRLCLVNNIPTRPASTFADATVVIYGDRHIEDPYAGPIVAVATGPTGTMPFVADTAREIAIAGHPEAKTEEITDGSGTPRGGQAIAWIDGSVKTAVLGRFVPESGLATIARDLRDALPTDPSITVGGRTLEQLYRGPLDVVAPTRAFARADYQLVFGTEPAGTLSGRTAGKGAFEAIRLLYPGLEHVLVAGKDALVGPVGTDTTTGAYARWREPDGIVLDLWIVPGRNQESTIDLRPSIAATRRLTRDEWVHLVEQMDTSCLLDSIAGDAGSVSDSGTSATTLAVPTTAP